MSLWPSLWRHHKIFFLKKCDAEIEISFLGLEKKGRLCEFQTNRSDLMKMYTNLVVKNWKLVKIYKKKCRRSEIRIQNPDFTKKTLREFYLKVTTKIYVIGLYWKLTLYLGRLREEKWKNLPKSNITGALVLNQQKPLTPSTL